MTSQIISLPPIEKKSCHLLLQENQNESRNIEDSGMVYYTDRYIHNEYIFKEKLRIL